MILRDLHRNRGLYAKPGLVQHNITPTAESGLAGRSESRQPTPAGINSREDKLRQQAKELRDKNALLDKYKKEVQLTPADRLLVLRLPYADALRHLQTLILDQRDLRAATRLQAFVRGALCRAKL